MAAGEAVGVVRRLIAGFVIAFGLFAVAIGVQRWFDSRAAESVVHALMAAVQSGNRDAMLGLLTPDRRVVADAPSTRAGGKNAWKKQRGMSYRIREMEINGDRAVASLTVEKDGYEVQPTVYLLRGETARWKIDRIEDLQKDPRYLKDVQAYERQQGEQLAEELKEALDGRDGVTIERMTTSGAPGSGRR